jgi:hypothetical protein
MTVPAGGSDLRGADPGRSSMRWCIATGATTILLADPSHSGMPGIRPEQQVSAKPYGETIQRGCPEGHVSSRTSPSCHSPPPSATTEPTVATTAPTADRTLSGLLKAEKPCGQTRLQRSFSAVTRTRHAGLAAGSVTSRRPLTSAAGYALRVFGSTGRRIPSSAVVDFAGGCASDPDPPQAASRTVEASRVASPPTLDRRS